jgi:hydrogenase maturation protein HypF
MRIAGEPASPTAPAALAGLAASVSNAGAVCGDPNARLRVRVEGVVQGVGFRPHVYRLAGELGLSGYVLNDERGVLLEIEGSPPALERFLERLRAEPPPLARIERVLPQAIAARGTSTFEILPSVHAGSAQALVLPDMATCTECLRELQDPRDRRYRYPFINCTNCGPRFTIATGVPYDRPLTTMAGFDMCELCRAEYQDPADRRFHAQPNACPVCGPRARVLWADGTACADGTIPGDAVRAAAAALARGLIVAVKGIGGYHLACRADSEKAVAALRARKRREERPFALMVASVCDAAALVELDAPARALLEDRARPIVIARWRDRGRVAAAVAPDCPDLGVMLPYTPLHHLLLADFVDATGAAAADGSESDVAAAPRALVMTSGNISDEPIAHEDGDALRRLGGIADVYLVHDRPIHMRTDDSVMRHTAVGTLMMRRSRGYVPGAIGLPVPAPCPLLACGAELKSTFCVAKGEQAWVSHHIGDLKNFETLCSFRAGVEHLQRLFAVAPQAIAHDLHPDYLASAYALERAAGAPAPIEVIGVQHHHAHLAACLAEHGESGPAVGAIFDGSGYGADGTVWGGELLVGDLRSCERAGRLRPVRLPGGDRAVREPWRMACAWLAEAHGGEEPPALPPQLSRLVTPQRWETIARLAQTELAPRTTSVGRLFDAIAALCGVRATVTYEGQAAIELEGAVDPVDPVECGEHAVAVRPVAGLIELDPRSAVLAVAGERAAGITIGTVAARFHAGLAHATALACEQIAGERDLGVVALAGGVFQNRVLLELTVSQLERAGLRTLVPRRLPPGDGAISYGQAAVAAARLVGLR